MDVIKPTATTERAPIILNPEGTLTTQDMVAPDLLMKTQKHFEVAKDNYPKMDMLKSVISMLHEAGLETTGDVLLAIRNIEMNLGAKASLDSVYQYLRLSGQIKDLIKQQQSLYGRR